MAPAYDGIMTQKCFLLTDNDELIHCDKASTDDWTFMGYSPHVMMIGSLYKPLHW